MIIDHMGLSVSNAEKGQTFYAAALAPLRIGKIMEHDGWFGFGRDGSPEFWFGEGGPAQRPMHIAFRAENRQQVRDFYDAALAAGGKDNGAPGLREEYHPTYYGAFIIDPDGHNIEAVCHAPEG